MSNCCNGYMVTNNNNKTMFQTPRPGGRSTNNSRGRGRPAVKKDDDEICVVEEKLTPLAKMKAKVGQHIFGLT